MKSSQGVSTESILMKEDLWFTYKMASRANHCTKLDNSFLWSSSPSEQGLQKEIFLEELCGKKKEIPFVKFYVYLGLMISCYSDKSLSKYENFDIRI